MNCRSINLRDPAETYSAAEFRDDALREMAEITRQGRVPVLVGGTMLYFRALLEGLSELPPADEDLRRELSQRLAEEGLQSLHGELQHRDPAAAARIEPTDRQRILRAHEVMALSGRTLSHMQAAHRRPGAPYRFLKLVVAPAARAELHRRIEQRFDRSGLDNQGQTASDAHWVPFEPRSDRALRQHWVGFDVPARASSPQMTSYDRQNSTSPDRASKVLPGWEASLQSAPERRGCRP